MSNVIQIAPRLPGSPLLLGSAHESPVLRLVYRDEFGSLQRATLSSSSRIARLSADRHAQELVSKSLSRVMEYARSTLLSVEAVSGLCLDIDCSELYRTTA
jgi:hypothetical protein